MKDTPRHTQPLPHLSVYCKYSINYLVFEYRIEFRRSCRYTPTIINGVNCLLPPVTPNIPTSLIGLQWDESLTPLCLILDLDKPKVRIHEIVYDYFRVRPATIHLTRNKSIDIFENQWPEPLNLHTSFYFVDLVTRLLTGSNCHT